VAVEAGDGVRAGGVVVDIDVTDDVRRREGWMRGATSDDGRGDGKAGTSCESELLHSVDLLRSDGVNSLDPGHALRSG
jgi:hypothetical protein